MKIIENKDWTALENRYAPVREMITVPQDKIHHAEGNVAIHTQLVLKELEKLPDYRRLEESEKEILWTAALFHDVEKRSTSRIDENGRISTPNHARKGEYTTRNILYRDTAVPFRVREQIVSLVRFHGLPIWFSERPEPQKIIAEVSLRTDTLLLKLLAEADARGRICPDADSLLESIEFFQAFCEEWGCWRKERSFASSGARFHYFNALDTYIDYIPHDSYKCEVTLLSGLPGMGKDYYIHTLDPEIPIIGLDDIRRKHKWSPTDKSANGRTVQLAKEEARCYLRKGIDFVWNATNITRMMRSQLIDLFTSYGAKVKIVYVEKPFHIWRKQNRERDYPLPESVLDDMLRKLEVPQLTEAHEVEYLTED